MSIIDIIWPWGALRRARILLDIARKNEETHAAQRAMFIRRLQRLEALVEEGHFRNPETGRLGVKGQVFK